jgi:hypothetical protein
LITCSTLCSPVKATAAWPAALPHPALRGGCLSVSYPCTPVPSVEGAAEISLNAACCCDSIHTPGKAPSSSTTDHTVSGPPPVVESSSECCTVPYSMVWCLALVSYRTGMSSSPLDLVWLTKQAAANATSSSTSSSDDPTPAVTAATSTAPTVSRTDRRSCPVAIGRAPRHRRAKARCRSSRRLSVWMTGRRA